MKLIEPYSRIIENELEPLSLPERIEKCGRICYKSEDKISPGSAEKFCMNAIKRGHNSVLEMATVTLYVRADRKIIGDFMALFTCVDSMKFLKISITGEDSILVTGSVRTFKELYENEAAFSSSAIARNCYRKINWMEGYPDYESTAAIDYELSCLAIIVNVDWQHILADSIPAFSKHYHVAVLFVVNRAVSHEIVRHRPCSFLQESQRYVRMDSGVTFVKPTAFIHYFDNLGCTDEDCAECNDYSAVYCNPYKKGNKFHKEKECADAWLDQVESCDRQYTRLLSMGASPQEARLVLPNSTKTELIVYTNLDEWKHIFLLRDHAAADPSMIEVMRPLHAEFKSRWPEVFGKE